MGESMLDNQLTSPGNNWLNIDLFGDEEENIVSDFQVYKTATINRKLMLHPNNTVLNIIFRW